MKQFPNSLKQWLVKGLSLVLVITLISSIVLYIKTAKTGSGFIWHRLNYWALIVACLTLVLSWLIEALRIKVIASALAEQMPFRRIFNINLATTFIGNITPFNSGGVPTQIYLLCRNGFAPGKASAIVTVRVVLSTLLFTTCAPFLFFFYHRQFSMGVARQITLIAIPVSALLSVLIVAFIIRPQMFKKIAVLLVKPFLGTKFNTKIQTVLNRLLNEIEIFHLSIKEIRKGFQFYLASLLTCAYWITFFTIAPLLIYAFGINASAIFFQTIILQFILVFIVAYLPIPGGSGVMELGVYTIFVFIPIHLRAIFILLWRFISYYLSTLVGGVILVKLLNRPVDQTVAAELPN